MQIFDPGFQPEVSFAFKLNKIIYRISETFLEKYRLYSYKRDKYDRPGCKHSAAGRKSEGKVNLMRKLIAVILAICMIFGLCSCGAYGSSQGRDRRLVAREISGVLSDSIYGGVHVNEYDQWSYEKMNMHENKNAPRTMTVSFDGIEYTGTYTHSVVDTYNNYESDEYIFGRGGWFKVISGTNKVHQIVLPLPEPPAGDAVESGKGRAKAMEIAGNYIDINEYELTVESNIYYDVYRFKKQIDGVICANLAVLMEKDGDLSAFDYLIVDEYNEIRAKYSDTEIKEAIARLTSEEADKLCEAKIEKAYSYDNMLSRESNLLYRYLVLLDDGSLGIMNEFDVNITIPTDDGYSEGGSRMAILVSE